MMKKILVLLIGIMFIILPFSTAAEDTNVSEKDIKHILYSEAFSDMEYEEFEKLLWNDECQVDLINLLRYSFFNQEYRSGNFI